MTRAARSRLRHGLAVCGWGFLAAGIWYVADGCFFLITHLPEPFQLPSTWIQALAWLLHLPRLPADWCIRGWPGETVTPSLIRFANILNVIVGGGLIHAWRQWRRQ